MISKLCSKLVFGEKFIILYIFLFGIEQKKRYTREKKLFLKNEIITMEGMSFRESAGKELCTDVTQGSVYQINF